MGRYQPIIYPEGEWGGLNEDENPDSLGRDELSECENVWRLGGTIATRPGTQRESSGDWDGAVTGTGASDACQGAIDVADSYDSIRKRIAVYGGAVYNAHDNELNKAAVTVSTGADNQWDFAQGRGSGTVKLYGVGGDQAGPDSFMSLATPFTGAMVDVGGAGWGGTWNGARYILEKWRYGFVAGMSGTPATDDGPMMVRYSVLSDMDVYPAANTIGGQGIGGLPMDGREFTTGLAGFESNRGDWLLVLGNQAIYAYEQREDPFTPFRYVDRIATGCVSKRAFVNLGVDAGDAIYMSEKGIHSLRQSQEHGNVSNKFLSWKIRKTFDTLNRSRLKFATAAYDARNGYVKFAAASGANLVNDVQMWLDVRSADSTEGITAENARWYVQRTGKTNHEPAIMFSGRDLSDNKPYVYYGNYTGDMVRWNPAGNFDDLGTGYASRFRLKNDDFGLPGEEKIIGVAHVWLGPSGDHAPLLQRFLDFGSGSVPPYSLALLPAGGTLPVTLPFTLGGADRVARRQVDGYGACETLAIEIRHAGVNQPFRIAKIRQDISAVGREVGDAAA